MAPRAYEITTLTAGAIGRDLPARSYCTSDIDYIQMSVAAKGTGTASALLAPLYSNTEPTMWSFLGGAATVGLTDSLYAKNYVQAIEEVLRWEVASTIRERMRYVSNAGVEGGYSDAPGGGDGA